MFAQIRWHSLSMMPLVVALGAALVLAVVWLYPAQVRQVGRPWRWVLPGLRATALLVLTASLLQPALQRLRRAEERAAVLVLVDRSRSMSVTDATRAPAQLVALADGLGRLPAGTRPAATAGLGADIERLRGRVGDVVSAGKDLQNAEAFGRGIEAARDRLAQARDRFAAAAAALAERAARLPEGDVRARLSTLKDIPAATDREAWAADARARLGAATVAAAAFQEEADRKLYESDPAVKAVCDELAAMSRWTLAEQALLRGETGLVPKIVETMPVIAYAVSDGVTPVALARGRDVKPQLPTAPDGLGSDVAGAVAAALAKTAGRPVRAVVLLSDGRQVGGEAAVVSGLTPAGVPVFAVAVAPPGPARDLAFAPDVSAPASAFVGETVTVRVSLAAAGLPAGAADVQLRAGEVVQTQRVAFGDPNQPAGRAEFSLRLEQGGPQKVVLTLPPSPGEVTAENNVIERWVKVLPSRMRVAAYSATAGRDFQFLRNALARTTWVQIESAVLDPAAPAVPLPPEQLLQQDVVILSDVPAAALTDVQWDALNELVRARGGSLFLLAGPDHLPASYTAEQIVASGLLPYDAKNFTPAWREWFGGEAAFRLVPSPRADPVTLDALRLGASGLDSQRRWQSLPGTFRYLPVPELNSKLNTRALLVEADSRVPVLTESRPGNGKVFFLGSDETWRWRFKAGEEDFDRFWLQLVRYAGGEPYAVRRDLLALDVSPIAPSPAEPVAVRARVLRADANSFQIQVLREGAVVRTHALAPAGAAGTGLFTASLGTLPEGDHLVRLTNPTDPHPAAATLDVPVHVAASSEAEMADLSGDDGVLRRLAESSGGEFLTLDRLDELQKMLAATSDNRSQYSELPLWDSPFLFLFVVACFGAEWALRKRFGLA